MRETPLWDSGARKNLAWQPEQPFNGPNASSASSSSIRPAPAASADASACINRAASSPQQGSTWPIAVNASWRVEFDSLQWILARRQGAKWNPSAYCCTREALLRNIRERCGPVHPDALARVRALPAWHPDRTGVAR
jgi:hypothetical protein